MQRLQRATAEEGRDERCSRASVDEEESATEEYVRTMEPSREGASRAVCCDGDDGVVHGRLLLEGCEAVRRRVVGGTVQAGRTATAGCQSQKKVVECLAATVCVSVRTSIQHPSIHPHSSE